MSNFCKKSKCRFVDSVDYKIINRDRIVTFSDIKSVLRDNTIKVCEYYNNDLNNIINCCGEWVKRERKGFEYMDKILMDNNNVIWDKIVKREKILSFKDIKDIIKVNNNNHTF